jgi:hypothetical protein
MNQAYLSVVGVSDRAELIGKPLCSVLTLLGIGRVG